MKKYFKVHFPESHTVELQVSTKQQIEVEIDREGEDWLVASKVIKQMKIR